ncbi:MAG: DEAD/DEAH box helicase [Candidatus Bathyarchaeota archaeon]|nr:DEAD/DEAH box helicase [Candidatus Bathyarchaeota archaeon]
MQEELGLTKPAFKMRGYQSGALKASHDAWKRGIKRQLWVLPTGSGKTVIFSQLPKVFDMPTMLVMAHRTELIDQAAAKLQATYPHLKVGIEMADSSAPDDCNIIIASKDSIGRKDQEKRLRRWAPDRFNIIVVDEAHRSAAITYIRPLQYLQPELLVGVTATPNRGDGVPLANVFDEVTVHRSLEDLINEGEKAADGPYLARLTGIKIKTEVDLTNLSIRAGDFKEEELAHAVNIDGRNSLIISAIEQHARDRKSILLFCVDRKHVETLTQQFVDRGHDADFVLGNTKVEDRAKRLKRFKDGELRIMVSCGVLTEGFDNPRVDCIVMARPTMSPLLFMQMVGRGCRPFPGKENCLVMDVCDVLGKHGAMNVGEAFGVRGVDFLGQDILEKSKVLKEAEELNIEVSEDETIEEVEEKVETVKKVVKGTISIETRAQMVNIFDACAQTEEVRRNSIFPWVKLSKEKYAMGMFSEGVITLIRNALGVWKMEKETENSKSTIWEAESSKQEAPFKKADNAIKKSFEPKVWKARTTHAKWRNTPATPKQIELLRNKFRIMALPRNLSRGAASDLLDYIITQKKNELAKMKKRLEEKGVKRDETGQASKNKGTELPKGNSGNYSLLSQSWTQ